MFEPLPLHRALRQLFFCTILFRGQGSLLLRQDSHISVCIQFSMFTIVDSEKDEQQNLSFDDESSNNFYNVSYPHLLWS